MRIKNYLRHSAVFVVAISVYLVNMSTANAQGNQTGESTETNYYKGMIESYLDPSYPQMDRSADKFSQEAEYLEAMRAYARTHQAFPMYNNTGNPSEDQRAYEVAKVQWFRDYPYFPQLINTGYPEQDRENFEKARREWKNRYPEKYRELYLLVTSDDELMREFAFIIQNQ